MKYFVFVNADQEKELDLLKRLHRKIEKKDDFSELLIDFVSKNRENRALIKNPILARDIFLSSIRQTIYSFKKLKKIEERFISEKNSDGEEIGEIRNAMILVFFMNAKFFLEMVKKHNMVIWNKDFEWLRRSITVVRNYLAHVYEKDFFEKEKAIIRIDPNQHLNGDLYVLQLYDIEAGKSVGEINFSIDLFYYRLRDIFKKIKDNVFKNK